MEFQKDFYYAHKELYIQFPTKSDISYTLSEHIQIKYDDLKPNQW